MSWLERKAAPTIPVVPDDRVERLAAIETSQEAYKAALQSVPDVDKIVAALDAHNERNHYRDRLMMAYGAIIHD